VTLYCRATLNYFAGGVLAPIEVEILDGRSLGRLSWRENGFELLQHESMLKSWATIPNDSAHYDEMGGLARELTGCDAVTYYPALVRSPKAAASSEDLNPVQIVHSDYTESYRGMIEDSSHPYRAILDPFMEQAGVSGGDIEKARRIVTLQFWRNIGPKVMDYPLTFCDANTVSRLSLTPVLVPEYGGLVTQFESFAVAPPCSATEHRWVTFPVMTRDEVVAFRSYDSDMENSGEPFWTPHTAFADPTVSPDAPARASVEMRAICLFAP